MTLPAISQTTSKGEIKSIRNEKGDTLIVFELSDAKKILSDLLECEITDSLLNVYIDRDSLNSEKIRLKDEVILKLETKNNNKDTIIENQKTIIGNKDEVIVIKDKIIKEKKDEIKKQKNLKRLGFVGCVVLPVITLFIIL
jgi:hypothetical protein